MASMERPALAQVGNLVAPPSRSLSAATHVPQGSSRTQFGAQVQTGETLKTVEDCAPGHEAYKSFCSAMENCAAISMHFEQFRRIQKGVKEMEPLLVRLKKDKLQVENARDSYAAKAAEAHQHVLKLLARNEELEAEIAYTENELVLRVGVEKERADKYLHDKVMAEKALEDTFAVNVSLQKQVLELQKKNSLLLAEAKTVNTMTMASQTIPEVSEVSTQNACTSAVTDFDSNAAFAGDDTPRLSQDSDLKIEEKVSAAQGTLQGVKKVQEEMMKSILQQMEALENQHICLQLGQVLLEDSPSAPAATLSPISCYKVGDAADKPASPVAVTAIQWNPIFDAPDSQPQACNGEIVASSTAAESENAIDTAPAVCSLAEGVESVSGTSATEGEVPSSAGRTFKGLDKQGDAADASERSTVALHTTAPRFYPMNIAATKHSSSPTIASASINSTHEQVASTMMSWTLTPYSFTPNSPVRALLRPQSPNTSASALQQRFLSPRAATSISAQPRHSDVYSLVQQSAAVSNLGPSSPIEGLLSAGSAGDVCMGFMQPLSPSGLMTSPGSCLQIRPWQPFSMQTPLTGASSQIMPLPSAQCSDMCEEKVDDTTRHDSSASPVEAPESTGVSEAPSAASCDVPSNIQHSVLEKDQSEGVDRTSALSLPVDAQEELTHNGGDEEDAQAESLSSEMSEEIDAADSDDESSVCDRSFGDGGDEVPESEVDGLNYGDFKACMTVGEFQNTRRHGTEFEDADYSPQDDEDSASSGSDDEEVHTTDARREVQKLLHDQLYSGLAVLVRCEHDDPDCYPPQTDAHPFDCAEFSFDDSSASDDEDYVPELTRIQEEGSEESCSEASSMDYGSDSDEELGGGSDSDLDPEGLCDQESSHASSSEAGDSDAQSDALDQEEQLVSKSNSLPVVAYRPILRQAMPLRPACKIVRFSTAGKSVDADKYLRNVGY